MTRAVWLLAITLTIAGLILARAPKAQLSAEALLDLLAERQIVDSGDALVSAELANVVLTTRLPAESIAVFERANLGPLTLGPLSLTAIQDLVGNSAKYPNPREPIIALGSEPDDAARQAMLDRMSSFASNYVKGLPRFICLETTRYFTSGRLPAPGKSSSGESRHAPAFRLDQKIVEELRYRDGAEEYRTKSIDDMPSTMAIEEVRGSFSRGEFGTILSLTFDPSTQAKFDWDHWENVQGKRMAAWKFFVNREQSKYTVCCISTGSVVIRGVRREQRHTWIAAYRGLIYADPASGVIRRFIYQTVDIPQGYNIDDSRTLLDFDNVKLKSGQTWLPARALHYTRLGNFRTKSEIDFSDFHSFESDSAIEFPTDEAPKK
jgi:hypothetical protein